MKKNENQTTLASSFTQQSQIPTSAQLSQPIVYHSQNMTHPSHPMLYQQQQQQQMPNYQQQQIPNQQQQTHQHQLISNQPQIIPNSNNYNVNMAAYPHAYNNNNQSYNNHETYIHPIIRSEYGPSYTFEDLTHTKPNEINNQNNVKRADSESNMYLEMSSSNSSHSDEGGNNDDSLTRNSFN